MTDSTVLGFCTLQPAFNPIIDLDELVTTAELQDLTTIIPDSPPNIFNTRTPQEQIHEIFQGIDPEYVEKLYLQELQNFLTGDELVQSMIDAIIQEPNYPRIKKPQSFGTNDPSERSCKRQKTSHAGPSQSKKVTATGRADDPIPLDSDDDDLTRTITHECQVCFDSFTATDMVACTNDESHLLCTDCVRSYVNSLLEQSKCQVICIASTTCDGLLRASHLAEILDDASFTRLERLQQDEDIRLAGIDGLEECPFCDFKAILPPIEEDREMRCQNPSCSEVSCRLCHKRSHVPKTCEEVVSDQKDKARHTVEEAMTEALVRKCNNCKQPFMKDDGCNKMTCPKCRHKQCYVCRQSITGYDHFGMGKCPQSDDTWKRHEDEVRKAQSEAKQKVLSAANEVELTDADVEVKFSEKVENDAKRGMNHGYRHLDFPFDLPEELVADPVLGPLYAQFGADLHPQRLQRQQALMLQEQWRQQHQNRQALAHQRQYVPAELVRQGFDPIQAQLMQARLALRGAGLGATANLANANVLPERIDPFHPAGQTGIQPGGPAMAPQFPPPPPWRQQQPGRAQMQPPFLAGYERLPTAGVPAPAANGTQLPPAQAGAYWTNTGTPLEFPDQQPQGYPFVPRPVPRLAPPRPPNRLLHRAQLQAEAGPSTPPDGAPNRIISSRDHRPQAYFPTPRNADLMFPNPTEREIFDFPFAWDNAFDNAFDERPDFDRPIVHGPHFRDLGYDHAAAFDP